MAIAIRNERTQVNSTINVTPMVDVMLVLLIIFMVITPLLRPGPKIQLAQATNPLQMPDAEDSRSHCRRRQSNGVREGRCALSLRRRSGSGGQRALRRRERAGLADG